MKIEIRFIKPDGALEYEDPNHSVTVPEGLTVGDLYELPWLVCRVAKEMVMEKWPSRLWATQGDMSKQEEPWSVKINIRLIYDHGARHTDGPSHAVYVPDQIDIADLRHLPEALCQSIRKEMTKLFKRKVMITDEERDVLKKLLQKLIY